MARPHFTWSLSLILSLLLKVLLDGLIALGAFLACFASTYLLGDQCFDNLEAGGRFVFHIIFYGATLLIAGFAFLTFAMTLLAFFYERASFRERLPKRILISLVVYGLILVLFYLFAVLPSGNYCSVSPTGR